MSDRPPDPECPECGTTLTFVTSEVSSGAFRTQAASMPQMTINYYDCDGCQTCWKLGARLLPDPVRQTLRRSSVMNPFVGVWIANLEKSRRHANHQFQNATLTFDVTGSDVSVTHAGVNMAGQAESGTTVLHADGVEHPVSPHAPGVVAVTRWIGPNILATEGRKDGRVVATATYAVSDDGRTLTATVEGVDAAGKAFDQAIVFDRAS